MGRGTGALQSVELSFNLGELLFDLLERLRQRLFFRWREAPDPVESAAQGLDLLLPIGNRFAGGGQFSWLGVESLLDLIDPVAEPLELPLPSILRFGEGQSLPCLLLEGARQGVLEERASAP